jgi:hypothetical protein
MEVELLEVRMFSHGLETRRDFEREAGFVKKSTPRDRNECEFPPTSTSSCSTLRRREDHTIIIWVSPIDFSYPMLDQLQKPTRQRPQAHRIQPCRS